LVAGLDLNQRPLGYEHNVALSEAVFGLLHGVEVAFRNAAHHALTVGYGVPDWYDRAPLLPYWQTELAGAKRKAGTQPGKVVAKLTFGFWLELVNKPHNNTLWEGRGLRLAFPNTLLSRNAIYARLRTVNLRRHRVAHHETIITSSNRLYAGNNFISLSEVVQCVEWVCPDTAHWLRSQFRYSEAARILAHVHGMNITL
jgi:hypothetical protein